MNIESGKIYIRKRAFPEWLTIWILALPLAYGTFFSFLKLPSFVKYTADIAWIFLLLTLLFKGSIILHKRIVPFLVFSIAFLIYTFVIYLFNFQSPLYYLWGVRNNFRFYVFFFAITAFFSVKDADLTLKAFDALFWVNIAVTLIQYFFLGYDQDRLGGIFGVEMGANAYTLIFLVIVVSRALLRYMSKKESAASCFSKCGISLFIAVVAELKVYFVIFLLLLGLSAVLTAFSWRKFVAILLGALATVLGSIVLAALFDFEGFFSLENLWELATRENYSVAGTVNRLSAIPTLAKTILTEFGDRLFGLGLGNCDTSSFAICNTPFYQTYGHLRYSWFSCAFLFLETGYMGLLIYTAFFGLCYFLARRMLKSGQGNPLFCQMTMIMAVISVVLIFYNSSLRTEAGYMVFFILALPFIGQNKETDRI